MFSQSFKNIISLRKKYLVAIVTLVMMMTLYLVTANMFSGLEYNKSLKSLHEQYVNTKALEYDKTINYLYYCIVLFGAILISVITKYIATLRAKEYSIYLIIAGTKKSSLYIQILIESIIWFTIITIVSFISFLLLQYPISYMMISATYGANVKYLKWYVDMHAFVILARGILTLWLIFATLHIYNFSKLSVKQLMVASKASETKKGDMILKVKDIVLLLLSFAAVIGTITAFSTIIVKSGGSTAMSLLPIFIVFGFIANIFVFKYLIKIIFIVLNKLQRKYNGFNKYYYSLIISKSATLSKILGSTASVIVVCISAIVVLENMTPSSAIMRDGIMLNQSLVNKSDIDNKKFNSVSFDYKKSGNTTYINKSSYNQFLKNYVDFQKKTRRNFDALEAELNYGSKVSSKKAKLVHMDWSSSSKTNENVIGYTSLTLKKYNLIASGFYKDHINEKNVDVSKPDLPTKASISKEEKFVKNHPIYLVDSKTYDNFKGKEDKFMNVVAKEVTYKKEFVKLANLKGTYTIYYRSVASNIAFNGTKLIIYVIPLLAFITQVSTMLFKFINSGWDNFRFTKLFTDLGFSKRSVGKIYLKETITIFGLPLVIGIIEAVFVAYLLIPTMLMVITDSKTIDYTSLMFGTIVISVVFTALGVLTYFQYKSISFKNK